DEERDEVALAEGYLERARKADPQNALPVAWLGVLYMVQAKSTGLLNKKTMANKGLALLDKAVAMDSRNPKVRLLRGSIGVKVPRAFGRYDPALQDLTLVEAAIKRQPSLVEDQNISRCVLYLNLGKAYSAAGDDARAKESWETAVSHERGRKENQEASEL